MMHRSCAWWPLSLLVLLGCDGGDIEELLPPGALSRDTVLVLTNGAYFNAAWMAPFSEDSTSEGDFTLLDGSTVRVPLMRGPAATAIGAGDGWVAAELLYAGEEVSMIVVVPDDLAAFEGALDTDVLRAVVDSLVVTDVAVTMPRFEARSHFSLRGALSSLGMAGAFELADFSNLSPEGGLAISDVIHEGFVKVNEEGTEAAAATAVIVGRVSVPMSIAVTRPFSFFIRDVETGALVFVGRVVDPSAPAG